MKALIAGAGIAGLTTALALRRIGWEVTVIEKAPGLRAGGYMLDFFGPGFEAAEELGVIEALRRHARGVGKLDMVDARGRTGSSMAYQRIIEAADGKLFPILRGDIERVLHDALPDAVTIRFGAEIVAVDDRGSGVTVRISTGETMEADLLVGADGIHSGVRRLVFGPETQFIRPLGFHTAAYFFDNQDVAAALDGDFKMMTAKDCMAGFYEVDRGRIMSFFVMRSDRMERPADVRATLQTAYGGLGWVLPAALDAAPAAKDIYYDIVAQVEMARWRRGRAILLGDAAYAVSLLAGQGASLAMAGGRALAQALEADRDIDAALERFETQLRPLVEDKQQAGRRMANWFVPATPAHALVRDIAIRVMNWPPLSGLMGQFFSVGSKGFSLARR
ncbi:FAD-dependent oxidoreductase [uncultured Devosia sp.]|uniref:FAD-dependent oxidoreductase n=1 Tax=uncultured Devosia sp. TaxID=211434 RepID=UPI00262FA70A|nr:FAD-dependent oxidoreductase [uncultured Devosia sp.]